MTVLQVSLEGLYGGGCNSDCPSSHQHTVTPSPIPFPVSDGEICCAYRSIRKLIRDTIYDMGGRLRPISQKANGDDAKDDVESLVHQKRK